MVAQPNTYLLDCWCQKQEETIMTIEIADRLVKLRKKYGYSQEELADKLGLSRQAVSKWERAEASPDTDNLICLAKLYGVSLDELLATDEDLDTIVEEQVKDNKEENKGEKVEIKDDHVVLFSKNGKKVTIDNDGVTCYNADGTVKRHEMDVPIAVIGAVEATLFTLALVAYIVVSAVFNWWHIMWVVFFIPEIICSIARAIRKKNANHFNMAFLASFAFFFVSWFLPIALHNGMPYLWHPMWAVFLAIPAYHSTVGAINKAMGKVDEDEKEEKDNDNEDK